MEHVEGLLLGFPQN